MPFVEAPDRQKIDTDAVLAGHGLARRTVIDPGVVVPGIVVSRFGATAAHIAIDADAGLRVEGKLDLSAWPPLCRTVAPSRMLNDSLSRLKFAAEAEAYLCATRSK